MDLMTIGQAAEYLQLSRETLYKYAQASKIPAVKVGRHWRFSRKAIDAWIEQVATSRMLADAAAAAPPEGYAFAPANAGGDAAVDSDPLPGTGRTAAYAPTTGQTDNTADAGLYQPAMVAGAVRVDVNGNGLADAEDVAGLNGVLVTLYDAEMSVVATTNTGVDGAYSFTNLPPGSYTVVETDPSGYLSTADSFGANDNQIAVTLVSGQTASGNDFLDSAYAAIAGSVLVDLNVDGTLDAEDTNGLAGVLVELLDTNGVVVASTYTDEDGNYGFTNVPPGAYAIRETDPGDYFSTGDGDGAATANEIAVELASGETSSGNYFLDFSYSSVSGFVWVDANGNGVLDDGEGGIVAGAVVELYDAASQFVASTVTDANGYYAFADLMPGTYAVVETDPSGYFSTGDAQGANDNRIEVVVAWGQAYDYNDFLDAQPVAIGDRVWWDEDADGLQDAWETNGFAFVPAALLDAASNVVATTAADGFGNYLFAAVPPGTYVMRFDVSYFVNNSVTFPDRGTDDALDSDGIEQIGGYVYTAPFDVASGTTNRAIDLGLLGEKPTRVVLYSFTLGVENGRVVVRWRTASEERTVGFWVERWDGANWARVNAEIVYAAGEDRLGASYALVDAGAAPGGTYTYRVVEEESDGGREIYGPFERTAAALNFADDQAIAATPDGVRIRWLSRTDESYKILRSRNLLLGRDGFETIAAGIPATPPQNEYLDEEAGAMGVYVIQMDDEP